MMKVLTPGFGFAGKAETEEKQSSRLENIAMAAVRRNFSPEFVNRIDATLTYQPLSQDTLTAILGQHIDELQTHIEQRLGSRGFRLTVSEKGLVNTCSPKASARNTVRASSSESSISSSHNRSPNW